MDETKETIEETLDASVLNKVQIKKRLEALETIDGRTALGKRLKAIEDTLADYDKRIKVCEVRR
jgi:hypothetical protein